MAQDLYRVLGLQRGATEAEIKKAYRGLAMEHHPSGHWLWGGSFKVRRRSETRRYPCRTIVLRRKLRRL